MEAIRNSCFGLAAVDSSGRKVFTEHRIGFKFRFAGNADMAYKIAEDIRSFNYHCTFYENVSEQAVYMHVSVQ